MRGQLEKERRPAGKDLKRSKNVMVRFSEREFEQIEEQARKANMKIAEYCRAVALSGRVRVFRSNKIEIDQDVLINLYRIGSNLNQLMGQLNKTRAFYMTYEEVLDAMAVVLQLKDIYQRILDKLK